MATAAFSGLWRDGGHTMLELVTVVAIVAAASALAYPALAGLRRGQELESAAVGLTQHLRLAHWRAVVTGARVRVAPRQLADGRWRFRVEREQGAAWVPDGDEQPIPLNTVVAIAGSAEKVFNPDGTCSLGSITLRGERGEVYRCTLSPATGRVRFYRGGREAGRGL
jgi:Tfp pilus assembly protein FimT